MSEKDTAAYKIFNKVFMCRVPYLASISDVDLELYGIPFVNDKEYDSYIRNQEIDRYLTINNMVELFRRGVYIKVANYKDTKLIYEIITEHLTNWKNALESGRYIANAPFDDLMDLDKLAAALYPYAKALMTTEFVESIIKRQASSTSLFNMKDIVSSRPDNQGRETINEQAKEEETTYNSMLDMFARKRTTAVAMTYDLDKPY